MGWPSRRLGARARRQCGYLLPVARRKPGQVSEDPERVSHGCIGSPRLADEAADDSRQSAERRGNGGHAEKSLVRRSLTPEEAVRLLAVSESRRVVYLTVIKTGLRRGEVGKITWGDVALEGDRPMIHLRASVSKNRRSAEQPIDAEVVEALRDLRRGAPESARVFSRFIPRMPRFRDDLKAAGIEFEDETGRRADFHALRMTYNMMIDAAGANGPTGPTEPTTQSGPTGPTEPTGPTGPTGPR